MYKEISTEIISEKICKLKWEEKKDLELSKGLKDSVMRQVEALKDGEDQTECLIGYNNLNFNRHIKKRHGNLFIFKVRSLYKFLGVCY
jgi:hypothetical protein